MREAVVARARACIGARFRPHGRRAELGLDCVGLAAAAFGRVVAGDYPLRGGTAGEVAARIEAAGLRAVTAAAPGDLLLLDAGRGQLHLAVLVPDGFVHADASLRRVVEVPGPPPWPVLGMWGEQG